MENSLKTLPFLFTFLLFVSHPASAAWLLWQHWSADSRVASGSGAENNQNKWRRTQDSWSLQGGYDSRGPCIAELPKRVERHLEVRAQIFKGRKDPTKTSRGYLGPDGISWLVTEAGTVAAQDDKPAEDYVLYIKFWCLPSDTDPKIIGDTGW
jgi:hypothetical protein